MINREPQQSFEGVPVEISEVSFFDIPGRHRSLEDLNDNSDELIGVVESIRPRSIALLRSQFTDISDEGSYGTFIGEENLSVGRRESQNEVFFGQLVISSFHDYGRTELIAAKPVDLRRSTQVHEFGVADYINNSRSDAHRELLTFQPLGFWRDEKGKILTLTKYENSVNSYDNLFWYGSEAELTEERIERAIARCVFGLGRLHATGLLHNDAQVKNLAVGNNGIRFIDLESFRSFKNKRGQVDEISVWQGIMRDLSVFTNSLVDHLPKATELSSKTYDLVGEALLKKAHLYSASVNLPTSLVPEIARLTEEDAQEQLTNDLWY